MNEFPLDAYRSTQLNELSFRVIWGGGGGGSYSTKGSYPKNTNQNAAHARNSADTTENSSIKLSFKMATLCIRMLIKW